MSRDGTYLLKYHPGSVPKAIEHDKGIIREQSPSVEFNQIRYDMLFFEMPKYTLYQENINKLHADQVLESCDGNEFEEKGVSHA